MNCAPIAILRLRDGLAADFNIDISEAGEGRFQARCRETGTETTSHDPEHDIAFALVRVGLPDGRMQTWRSKTPSLLYRSMHRAAGRRIELGEHCPYRIVDRREGPLEIFKNPVAGVRQEPRDAERGTHPSLRLAGALP